MTPAETPELACDAMAAFAAPSGLANWRDACTAARKERLNRGLLTLASWAQIRATGEHDDETSLTMLERKTTELRAAVNKAGWDSVAASHSPNRCSTAIAGEDEKGKRP